MYKMFPYLFPIDLPRNMGKPCFLVVKTKCKTQDSAVNSNLSSPNYFQNHFLMYKLEPI